MIDKRLFKLKGIMTTLLGLVILTGIQGLAILAQGIFLARAIVSLWQGQPVQSALASVGWFAVAFIVRQILIVVKNELMANYANQAVETYRVQLLARYTALGSTLVAEQGTGNAVTTLGAGLDNVKNYFQLLLVKVFDLGIIPWLILSYIFYLKWEQGLFLLLIFPVIIVFFVILGLAAQSKADAEFANFKNLNNRFVDALRGLPTLKQLGLAEDYSQEIFKISEDYRKTTMRTLRIAMTSTFALDFFTTLSIAVVAVFLGFDLLDGKMTLLPALTTDVLEMLDKPEVTQRNVLHLSTWTPTSTLSVSDMNFGYDGTLVLKNMTLQAKGYQKIAIVGESGAGKSTLLNLLGGFLRPNSGDFEIDGQTIPHFAQKDWQKQFFYMPQHPYIFHETLRDNITFYAPQASDAAVAAAIEQAGLQSLVATLPDGLDTVMGESGRQVSGGQAQRIALARMLLDEQRHVLLFDEPTARLDIDTEYELKQTIAPILANHLVFFATHRLHWLDQMDYVLVMRDGQIVEQGEPAVLLADSQSALNHLRSELRGGQ